MVPWKYRNASVNSVVHSNCRCAGLKKQATNSHYFRFFWMRIEQCINHFFHLQLIGHQKVICFVNSFFNIYFILSDVSFFWGWWVTVSQVFKGVRKVRSLIFCSLLYLLLFIRCRIVQLFWILHCSIEEHESFIITLTMICFLMEFRNMYKWVLIITEVNVTILTMDMCCQLWDKTVGSFWLSKELPWCIHL